MSEQLRTTRTFVLIASALMPQSVTALKRNAPAACVPPAVPQTFTGGVPVAPTISHPEGMVRLYPVAPETAETEAVNSLFKRTSAVERLMEPGAPGVPEQLRTTTAFTLPILVLVPQAFGASTLICPAAYVPGEAPQTVMLLPAALRNAVLFSPEKILPLYHNKNVK
jgi:hypothetical protein